MRARRQVYPDEGRLLTLRRRSASGISGLAIAALMAAGAVALAGQTGQPAKGKPARDPDVTPVAGPSWLNQLGVKPGDTTLGRGGATYGPPPGERTSKPPTIPFDDIGRAVVLTGADLYRLNCQACHRAEGTGAAPDVKSVLGLVQGSSLAVVRKQLSERGKGNVDAAARAQSAKARTELHNRVLKGGQKMPPLAHLQEADFAALYAYLTELAGSPDARPPSRRTVSWWRLGEHVVKGTCHICHDAVGPKPSNEAMMRGTIPSFTTLLAEKPVVDFLTKVRTGAPVTLDPVLHYRGRMPVFPHIRDVEVAAAYMFLVEYPPQAAPMAR